jgi:hypothetical protein
LKIARIIIASLAFASYVFYGNAVAAPAPARDEAMASRFLYCSYVSEFFYKYLSKNEPNNKSAINGYREGKNIFWLAASKVSDGPYLTSEKDKALQKVIELLEQEKREKSNLMDAEAQSCLGTLKNDAIPLFQSPKATRE